MIPFTQINNIQMDKAFYHPGETIQLEVSIESNAEESIPARLVVRFSHLATILDQVEEEIYIRNGDQSVSLASPAPQIAPRGYGLDVEIRTESGTVLAKASAAFDVLENWTQTPRYGFISDFFPDRADFSEVMQFLTRFHINGLQFYDWMFRHEQFLTNEDPYFDLLGRKLSRETVDLLIKSAHEHGIAAMPYTAVYGASVDFYDSHASWALLDYGGKPYFFGENFMVIMDPRPRSPWTAHLLAQFDQILKNTTFDGIHLDQYGSPQEGYDENGKKFDLAPVLAEFINQTKEHVLANRLDGAVVFNAVGNWPIENVASANQDIVYIEVWPPYIWFKDLHDLIVQAQALGNGKPVVLAAYIEPSNEVNVRLTDAVIFASGGSHIELGEQDGMLADAYFPKYKKMSSTLTADLVRMYDFAVRYQDLIGPRTMDVTSSFQERITIEGITTAPNNLENKVWPILRQSERSIGLNLINLIGLKNPEWKDPILNPPKMMTDLHVHITGLEEHASSVWLASPDRQDLSPQTLEFVQQNNELTLIIPSLTYWDLIVIEWK